MALYPHKHVVTKNAAQSLIPASKIEVTVYNSNTATTRKIYSDAAGSAELTQPIETGTDGSVFFYTEPGRIRIDAKLDAALTVSTEEVITDQDNILTPLLNQTPSGALDSNNTTFTLDELVRDDLAALYVNGERWKFIPASGSLTANNKEFKISGKTLTFAKAPTAGDTIIVDYFPQR